LTSFSASGKKKKNSKNTINSQTFGINGGTVLGLELEVEGVHVYLQVFSWFASTPSSSPSAAIDNYLACSPD
jgi:hypothetical protein